MRSDHHGHDWQGPADAPPREEVGARDSQGHEPVAQHGAQVPAWRQSRGAAVPAGNDAHQADGIYIKMITSATGLIIGILAYLGYSYLNTQIHKVENKMDAASAEFMDILQEPTR